MGSSSLSLAKTQGCHRGAWTPRLGRVHSITRAATGERPVPLHRLPLIGAGTGSFSSQRCEQIMREQMDATPFDGEIVIVRFSQR